MQRYASHWTGDIDFTNAFYRGHIIGLQASGLAAFPFFNHDAGGFGANAADPTSEGNLNGPDDNFYIQWGMALGSFTPLWRPHGYGFPRWPLNRSLASQDAFRRYGTLRYELMPYIYGLAHQAHASGLPMARAMALAHPDNPEAWLPGQQLQYMWGDAFLVAPPLSITAADQPRTAWFPPAAEWYDFWTDIPLTLGRDGGFHTFTARFGYLPVFVRAGSIVPRREFALSTSALSDRHLILDVYTGADGATVVHEDDGVTERFRTRGELRRTPIAYSDASTTLAISPAGGTYSGASADRSYLARFRGLTSKPSALQVDGAPVTIQSDPLPAGPGLAAVWDAARRLLEVRIPQRPASQGTFIAVTRNSAIEPPPIVGRPVQGLIWERWNQPAQPDFRSRWNAAPEKTAFLRGLASTTPDDRGEGPAGSAVPASLLNGDNFLARLTGWLTPPQSGTYRFWVYGDDRAELHIQLDPRQPGLTRVAHNSQSQTVNQWDEEDIQRSGPIPLETGRSYAFEFFLSEFTGNAHGAFGWTLPDGSLQRPIPNEHLLLATGQFLGRWLSRHGIPPSDLSGDADGDGLANLLEAGLGTFPSTRDAGPPELAFVQDGRRVIRLPFPSVDEIIVDLQDSEDLSGPWSTLARWTAATHWRLVDPIPAAVTLDAFALRCFDERPGHRRFFRILVTLP